MQSNLQESFVNEENVIDEEPQANPSTNEFDPKLFPKDAIRELVIDGAVRWNDLDPDKIQEKLKYSLSKFEKGPWNPNMARSAVVGYLTGMAGELLSGATEIDMSSVTVFPKGRYYQGTMITDLRILRDGPQKMPLLSRAAIDELRSDTDARKSMEEAALSSIGISPKGKAAISDEIHNDFIDALAELEEQYIDERAAPPQTKNKQKIPAGTNYFQTSLPDGLIVQTHEDLKDPETGEVTRIETKPFISGILEVKSYTPQEVKTLIEALLQSDAQTQAEVDIDGKKMNLGFDLDKQIQLLNLVAKQNNAMGSYSRENIEILLRFPADIPDSDLEVLGNYLQKVGFERVAIQKQLFTSDEIRQVGIDLLKAQMDKVMGQETALNFSSREITLLKEITGYREDGEADPRVETVESIV